MEFHVCSKTTRLNTISRILERHKDREIYDKFKYLRTWRHEIYIEHIEKAYKLIRILFGITYMQSMKKNLIPKLVCYNKDIKSDPVHIWNFFVECFFSRHLYSIYSNLYHILFSLFSILHKIFRWTRGIYSSTENEK